MSRSTTMRRTALLSALTAFAIPEMRAEPSHNTHLLQKPERHVIQAQALGSGDLRVMQVEPTQRWVF